MPAPHSFHLIRRLGLPLALAGLLLMIALGLAEPAAAQFGMGRGGFGMGIMVPPVQSAPPQQSAPPPPSNSRAEHKSYKVKTARRSRAEHERHAKEERTKVPAKSDSNSSGAF